MKQIDTPLNKIDVGIRYFYPNIYDGTKYNHHVINERMHEAKKGDPTSNDYFLKLYGLEYSVDYNRMAYCLYDYYCDLNKVINRMLYKGIKDLFVTQLRDLHFSFLYVDRLNKLTALYDEVFLPAFMYYMEHRHPHYDETFGKSYKDFFDIHFGRGIDFQIYFHISRLIMQEQKTMTFEKMRKEKVYVNDLLSEQEVLDFNLHYENSEYYQSEKEGCLFLNSSELLLTTD